jgi:acyl-CoA reductase-like NAD-dependent aldehyde dehydrogenase
MRSSDLVPVFDAVAPLRDDGFEFMGGFMSERPRKLDLPHAGEVFIGGAWQETQSRRRTPVIDPTTQRQVGEIAAAGTADIDAAVASARNAFDRGPWPRMSHSERAQILRALAEGLRRRAAHLAHLWSMEVGVLHKVSGFAAATAAAHYDFYASLAEDFPFEESFAATGGGGGRLVREPVGVVGAIVPWNAPLLLAAVKTAPALLAGCTIILKASLEAPFELLVLAEAAAEAGVPPGVFNVLAADREESEHLVVHPDVDKISFTGSTAAGRRIGALCGGRMARCTLELGGKSPAVILEDADIGQTAATLANAGLRLSGQVCAALTRIIVSQHRHDELVDGIAQAFAKVRVGDPYETQSDMGPLVSAVQRDRVLAYIRKGTEEGAQLVTGGVEPPRNEGFFVSPTLFASVDNRSTIAREEIFGPVLSVIPARDEEDAIRLANDSPYGLNSSVFSADRSRAEGVARQLRAGTVAWNRFATDFQGAFGGFKQSGIGREGGREGLHPYLETKTLLL